MTNRRLSSYRNCGRALWLVVAIAAAAGGCGYSLPYLAANPGSPSAATSATPQPKAKAKDAAKAARAAKAEQAAEEKRAATAARGSQATDASKAEKSSRTREATNHSKRPKTSKPSNHPKADQDAPRATTLRERIDEARATAAAAPAEPYWPYHVAELCVTADSLDAATAALRQSLGRDSGYAPALALFSKLEYDAGRHDDAIAVLESARMAAQRASRDLAPELLAGLALHYDASGRAADAHEALGAVPHAAHAASDAAAAAVALRGGADTAPELAESAAHEHPKSAACQNNLGIARLRAGDPEGARKAFTQAVELDPRLPGAYYNLTILEKFYALDDAAALAWFAKYRALSNDDPDGLASALGVQTPKDLAEGSKP